MDKKITRLNHSPRILLILLLTMFIASYANAMRSQYLGGEINISTKNNQPCLYIDDKNLKGIYYIHLFESHSMLRIGSYFEDFSKRYPMKNQCLPFSALKPTKKLNQNKPYLVVLEAGRFIFGKKFCIASNNNKETFIQEVNSGKCETVKSSFLKNLLKLF
ncbi:hypothetical protein KTH06_02980 [Acinetobacter ursingii]|uniref:NF045616 family extracytoplasmic (lipo)protein n=1 Tax=Acinetobacter ursingii TaxID=108980 RepID=UPI000E6AACE4|nr:NF045616 family extracytoplasmic (lipo)protein [Acinetobacter ursingii]MCU4304798.1 hypothetical protein [Acinetobacter ursingii]MCU4370803.1 hypothetical protein [Acinetobacter ursingii]MDG9991745.1 hypothetical protein [Acinetobacter ursingii]MDH0205362.1 hypothetical protein [Acinetobacter ursingii]